LEILMLQSHCFVVVAREYSSRDDDDQKLL
jgi:hypothetical protein